MTAPGRVTFLLLCLIAVYFDLASSAISAEQIARCSTYQGVKVVYKDSSELDAACLAVSDVVGYFRNIGFDVPTKAELHFADRGGEDTTGRASEHSYFDPQRLTIVIYRQSDAKPWNQPWSPRLLDSFMRHELVHLAIWEVLQGNFKQLRREWHEFIAYAIQFDMMDPELRQAALATSADVAPARDLVEINEFSYGMNPEGFAVLAYLTFRDRGAAAFVRKLLNAEIVPTPFSYPFAVLPNEVQR